MNKFIMIGEGVCQDEPFVRVFNIRSIKEIIIDLRQEKGIVELDYYIIFSFDDADDIALGIFQETDAVKMMIKITEFLANDEKLLKLL